VSGAANLPTPHIFKKLLDRGMPVSFVQLLLYWCSNLQCRVKWNNVLGDICPVLWGFPQGGVLSPVLFALYIDGVISELRLSGHGVQNSKDQSYQCQGQVAKANDILQGFCF